MRLEILLYFHHHILAGLVIFMGGIFASWMLYTFLLTTASLQVVEEKPSNTTIKREALGRVTLWNSKRREEAKLPFTIPSSVFASPPSIP